MPSKYDLYRKDFVDLNWSKGLSRDELMMACVSCPPELLSTIPGNRKFTSFEEFWDYFTAPVTPRSEGQTS